MANTEQIKQWKKQISNWREVMSNSGDQKSRETLAQYIHEYTYFEVDQASATALFNACNESYTKRLEERKTEAADLRPISLHVHFGIDIDTSKTPNEYSKFTAIVTTSEVDPFMKEIKDIDEVSPIFAFSLEKEKTFIKDVSEPSTKLEYAKKFVFKWRELGEKWLSKANNMFFCICYPFENCRIMHEKGQYTGSVFLYLGLNESYNAETGVFNDRAYSHVVTRGIMLLLADDKITDGLTVTKHLTGGNDSDDGTLAHDVSTPVPPFPPNFDGVMQ